MDSAHPDYAYPDSERPVIEAHIDTGRASDAEEQSFDRIASAVAGEPLLGPIQSEFIRAISQRLAHGPPMSAEDRATYLDQLGLLRIAYPTTASEDSAS